MGIRHWIEEKGDCGYCGGSDVCSACGGVSDMEEFGRCEECHGSGACAECIGGREQWLYFERGGRVRGSCLRRSEALRFGKDGTLPGWWQTYHGLALEEIQ